MFFTSSPTTQKKRKKKEHIITLSTAFSLCIYTRHMLHSPLPTPNKNLSLSLSLSPLSTMKPNIHSVALLLILVLLLITTSHTSSRKLASKQEINSNKSVTEMEDTDSFPNLMGLEECGNKDEECLNRRILADAHLDYIYTQHHKP
ncbi:putative phytosulfokines 6 [Salvia miltiorrhiza]|uniref:putative phytosulfokines 6 n=1 Tax=Salvia miltiorrhiza TaxID=226208 RepID=UPI0025ACB445|nr:putative phytosulfokines 6 [Salvia miltiorrhiza]